MVVGLPITKWTYITSGRMDEGICSTVNLITWQLHKGNGLMDQVVSELILDIHRGSTAVSVHDFKHWAFEKIQEVLPFDSAVWVSGHIKDKQLIADDVVSFNQPPGLYRLREEYEEYPGLLERMMGESGITLTREMVARGGDFRDLRIYKEYFSKYDMEHALGTVKRRQQADLYSYVALYRAANGEAFTEQERRTKETLLLHMVESYKYCLFYHFIDREHVDSRNVGKVVADNDGVIRDLSDNVASWFKRQWPEWKGPYLPAELKELGTEVVREFKTFRAKIHAPKDGLIGIELHPV